MNYERPSGPILGTRRMINPFTSSPPRQIIRSPSMSSLSPINREINYGVNPSGVKIVTKGKGIDANESNQIQLACISGVQSGATPLSRTIANDIKRRLGGEWFVFISTIGHEDFNFSLTRCKGSDFLVLLLAGKKIQINRLRGPSPTYEQSVQQPIVQSPPEPYLPPVNNQQFNPQNFVPEVQSSPYIPETQPYIPEVQSTPYIPEQSYNQQPYIPETQPYVPEAHPYIPESQGFTQQSEVQSTPYLPDQSYNQQPYIPEVQNTPINFDQQPVEPEVETSQYFGDVTTSQYLGDQSPRNSIYSPAQTPLVSEPGAPLTESVNASYFGPATKIDSSNYKLIAKGIGINNNEATQITSTCCAASRNDSGIPLSRVCAEGIKARLGGDWFVFISDYGIENYNFSMTRCKGSDYMVFVVGTKKFQVCRLRGFS